MTEESKYQKIQGEMKIKINDNELPGKYANQVVILSSPEEFIIDFIAAFPPEGSVVSRVVLTPGHFKRIIRALEENLASYEKQHGEIKIAGPPAGREPETSIH